jgi:AcrR family transcriptional regulator
VPEPKFKQSPRAQSPDYDDKRNAVLNAAAELFSERGFENTSMGDLTRALGVTRPTVYYYFENKEDILFSILEIAQERIREALAHAVTHESTARKRLEIVIRSLVKNSATTFGKIIVKTNPAHLSPAARDKMKERYKNSYRIIRSIIRDGIEDGSLAPVNVKMAAFALLGVVNWQVYWYHEGGDMTPEEIATNFLAILENGLLPRQ